MSGLIWKSMSACLCYIKYSLREGERKKGGGGKEDGEEEKGKGQKKE